MGSAFPEPKFLALQQFQVIPVKEEIFQRIN